MAHYDLVCMADLLLCLKHEKDDIVNHLKPAAYDNEFVIGWLEGYDAAIEVVKQYTKGGDEQ